MSAACHPTSVTVYHEAWRAQAEPYADLSGNETWHKIWDGATRTRKRVDDWVWREHRQGFTSKEEERFITLGKTVWRFKSRNEEILTSAAHNLIKRVSQRNLCCSGEKMKTYTERVRPSILQVKLHKNQHYIWFKWFTDHCLLWLLTFYDTPSSVGWFTVVTKDGAQRKHNFKFIPSNLLLI